MEHDVLCEMCGKKIDGPGILLNRFVVFGAAGNCMHERRTEDDEYIWSMDEDDRAATGIGLCWPTCAAMLIEGEMIELGATIKRE